MSSAEAETNAAEVIAQTLRRDGLREELVRGEIIRALLKERCRHHAVEVDAYQRLIERDSAERDWWREQIAVPETWLFRYPASFDYLREWGTQRLRSAASELRVLSVACASGAEPFSVVATLRAAARLCGGASGGLPVRVTAIDPNAGAIARARSGRLPVMALRAALPEWAAADFEVTESGPIAVDALQSHIEWCCDSAPQALKRLASGSCDAVFCRNLAIYLDESKRMQIGGELQRVLSPAGLLFLGHAERPAHFGLEEVVTAAPSALPAALVYTRRTMSTAPCASARDIPVAAAWSGAVRPRPATGQPVLAPPSTRPTLAAAVAAADEGRADAALELCEALHGEGHREPALLRLLGVLALGRGDDAGAEAWLRKAEYADSGDAETLLHLAFLADRRGDGAGAARLRDRAARGKVGENASP